VVLDEIRKFFALMQNRRLAVKVPISGRQDGLQEGRGARSAAPAVLF